EGGRGPERLLQAAGEVEHALVGGGARGRRRDEGDPVVVGLGVALVLVAEPRDREGAVGAVEAGHGVGGADAVAAGDVREAVDLGPLDLGPLEQAADAARPGGGGDGDVGGVEGVAEAEPVVLAGAGDPAEVLERAAEAEAEDLAAGG